MVKKLGYGMMRLPLKDVNDYSSVDIEQTKKLVDVFLSKGFTYFDTAYPYHNGMSEEAFRETVVKRYPRKSFTVTDKMPCWLISSANDFQKVFDTQLKRCGVDYFDYYWLHALNKDYYANMQKYDGFGFIAKMKAEGKIRHIGFSFHYDSVLLERILKEHPEVEYVQLQINYLDWESPTVESRKCLDIVTRYGKPVIVMEPVKGGSLAKVPEAVEHLFKDYHPDMTPSSWAIRYAASCDNVFMVLIGMSNMEQVMDNVGYMSDFQPINNTEREIIEEARSIIEKSIAIPCTACHYCTEGCPQQICIPEYFSLYNTLNQFGKERQWMNTSTYYSVLSNTHGKASDCIECGQCEEHCPQHITIIDNLKKVAKIFD